MSHSTEPVFHVLYIKKKKNQCSYDVEHGVVLSVVTPLTCRSTAIMENAHPEAWRLEADCINISRKSFILLKAKKGEIFPIACSTLTSILQRKVQLDEIWPTSLCQQSGLTSGWLKLPESQIYCCVSWLQRQVISTNLQKPTKGAHILIFSNILKWCG